ncbi:hypothetical protein [Vibrio vulnificus]|uniref:hypothetical protein n=1 Tax=Vibrio vulnificus TaxID=672 RepID=UPI001CDC9643|nr:hypothetical protein [Vibrio vulnificus]EIV8495663.1 hypothetical protein [Vibrio vulnificus]ELE1906912.1 hypothetical protein [Vibrio vulnificus]ELV8671100.1 hypothetical protein [Vibrio vulnificus]MCA3942630.1 hypothetical protein [Vibrio vulnificus]MCU8182491.1 hypothetical protein [Vibrio vulnificus]
MDVFEPIKPTKSVRSAFAEEWIPACAGMTDRDSGKIYYCPRLCLLASLLLVIPACSRMTDIESGEISYRPWLLLVILANAGIHLKARGCF